MYKITYFTQKTDFYTKDKIEELINKNGEFLKKDNTRSIVKLLDINGDKIIIKQPVDKNIRKWIRFLTIFRDSESLSSLKSMDILNKNEIQTNTPILCIEYRKYGMVFDSYMIYEYLAAGPVNTKDAEKVMEIIKKIHRLGYLHGDTQKRNFLKKNGKIIVIDSKLKKKTAKLGKIAENMEYIGFARDINEAYAYIDRKNIWYKTAYAFYRIGVIKRRIKKMLRKQKIET